MVLVNCATCGKRIDERKAFETTHGFLCATCAGKSEEEAPKGGFVESFLSMLSEAKRLFFESPVVKKTEPVKPSQPAELPQYETEPEEPPQYVEWKRRGFLKGGKVLVDVSTIWIEPVTRFGLPPLEPFLKHNCVIVHDIAYPGHVAHANFAKAVKFFADRGWEVKAMTSCVGPGLTGPGLHLYAILQKEVNDKVSDASHDSNP